jgi:hypothetical protein
MFRVLPTLTILLVLGMFADTTASGVEPQHRGERGPLKRMYSRVHDSVGAPYYAPIPESYDAGWNYPQMYPKYYAGFHFRYMQIYGYPYGEELGLRGTAW